MRLMFFYFFLRAGGIEGNLTRMANYFSSDPKNKVSFALMSAMGHFLNSLDLEVKVIDLGLKPFAILDHIKCIFRLAKAIRQERPNFIITGLPAANITLVAAKFLSCTGKKTKIIISERGPTLIWLRNRKNHFLLKLVLRISIIILYRFADQVVVVSDFLIRDLSKIAFIPEQRIKRIYNPVITSALIEKANQNANHPWLLEKTTPVLLAAGRLSSQKNFPLLLRGFAAAYKERPDMRLIILGEGPERQDLEKVASELGITDAISIPGFNENPYAFFSKADIFVLSSDFEGLPTVLIEALASGCSVVSTDCPSGPDEILEGGKYGILIPVGDVEALKSAILDVLSDPEAAEKRTKDFQAHKMHEFSADNAIKEYGKLMG